MKQGFFATARAKVERFTVAGLLSLPSGVKRGMARLLAPAPAVPLDANIRFLLAASEHQPNFIQKDVAVSRKIYTDALALLDRPFEKVEQVRDHQVPVKGGQVLVREYRPRLAATPTSAVFFIHGGGFTIGSVADYDNFCRWFANTLGRPVFSLDYRLAPEHRYPTAVEDTLAAWEWLQAQALELGVDPQKIAVAGDSAGGCLSVILSQQAKVKPVAQCLIYPTVDQTGEYASKTEFAEGYGLTKELKKWFMDHYLPADTDLTHPYVSPLLTPELGDQPTTILVTATDPLRDEGLAYGKRLEEAGVAVTYFHYSNLIHGFVTMGGLVPAAGKAVEEFTAELSKLLKQ